MNPFNDARDWFLEKRYGLFVHWGIYSVNAWHEQDMWRRSIPRGEYEKLAEKFNPEKFDPDAWLDLAEEAGMQSITITAKHHDGFCMWDTKQTDFNIMNTPYAKDPIAMLAEACHARAFPLRFYYSIVDWHHPNYPTHGSHHEMAAPLAGDEPDREKYVAFLRAQIEELCTTYGEIHGIWWDMNTMRHHDEKYGDPSINEMIRKLQPKAVINNRGFDDGDFGTPERDFHKIAGESGLQRRTEACQSLGSTSWGYREAEDYYTHGHLVRSIDGFMARGANYLLNVGPRADGTIDPKNAKMLRGIGAWYASIKESFDEVEQASGLVENTSIHLTRRGDTLYVHMPKALITESIDLYPLPVAPKVATLLNTGEMVEAALEITPSRWQTKAPYLRLRNLPVSRLADTAGVVRLEFAPGALPYEDRKVEKPKGDAVDPNVM